MTYKRWVQSQWTPLSLRELVPTRLHQFYSDGGKRRNPEEAFHNILSFLSIVMRMWSTAERFWLEVDFNYSSCWFGKIHGHGILRNISQNGTLNPWNANSNDQSLQYWLGLEIPRKKIQQVWAYFDKKQETDSPWFFFISSFEISRIHLRNGITLLVFPFF